jgi:hypothetical protein
MRIRRFLRRRIPVLVATLVCIVALKIAAHWMPGSSVEIQIVMVGLCTYAMCNVWRLLWILSLVRKTQPRDWSPRIELACSVMVAGVKISTFFPCHCSLSGQLSVAEFIQPATFWATLVTIAAIFGVMRNLPVATFLSVSFVASLRILQLWFWE